VNYLHIVCLVLLIWSTITDLRTHEIKNVTTYTGTLTALAMRFYLGGWVLLEDGLKGLGLCFLIMLVCYILYNIGAGDLKLISMTGAFLGVEQGITLLLWTLTIGAVSALIILIWKYGSLRMLLGITRHLWLIIKTCRWIPLTTDERTTLQSPLYLAPAALLAFLLTCGEELLDTLF
jgi:prepilin peptidase CpaA